jgi:hypothetical protein
MDELQTIFIYFGGAAAESSLLILAAQPPSQTCLFVDPNSKLFSIYTLAHFPIKASLIKNSFKVICFLFFLPVHQFYFLIL